MDFQPPVATLLQKKGTFWACIFDCVAHVINTSYLEVTNPLSCTLNVNLLVPCFKYDRALTWVYKTLTLLQGFTILSLRGAVCVFERIKRPAVPSSGCLHYCLCRQEMNSFFHLCSSHLIQFKGRGTPEDRTLDRSPVHHTSMYLNSEKKLEEKKIQTGQKGSETCKWTRGFLMKWKC